MKKITSSLVLKLNLALIFIVSASVYNVCGQTTSKLAEPSQVNVRTNDQSSSPYFDTALNEYSTAIHQQTPQSRPMADSFSCEDGLVFVISNTVSSKGLISGLYSYNLGTKTQKVVKDPLVESDLSSQFINAIGYNVMDNYIYGLLQATDQVVKIDATGAMEYLTVKGDFKIADYSSGDVDKNGLLYLYGQNKFISINLNPTAPDYMEAKTLLNYSTNVNDITFSPIDDNLYMMTSTGSRTLLRFNTSTNTITTVGRVTGLEAETTHSFGTAFMDSVGNMYVSNNSSGNIYKIASPHSGEIVATWYNTLYGTPGDGARCPNQVVPSNANDDHECGAAGEVITIDLLDNDGSGSYPFDPTTVQLVDPANDARSTSVTVAGQGNFKIDNKGILTFTPEATFTETSIQYTFLDSKGMSSNIATITVTLNTTATPSGASIQEFCQSDQLTLRNLRASGTDIKWYESETSTRVLPILTRLKDGVTYYATQTSAETCESLERLAVTVKINEGIALVKPETVTCSNNQTTYTVEAIIKGSGTFKAKGTGAPGKFINNGDETTTWISDAIPSDLGYSIEFQEASACNILTLEGVTACCVFEVECPLFSDTTVDCYDDLPAEISYSVEAFEALGGKIGDNLCGIVQITASNSADNGSCSQNITRTYTITEYEDTNNNGIIDANENTVLNTSECIQVIKVEDVTAPNLVTDYDAEITITCDNIPDVPSLIFEDGCSNEINIQFNETSTTPDSDQKYVITRTWTVADSCGNEAEHTQTINVNVADAVVGNDTELCIYEDIDFDLFSLLSGTYDTNGTWSVVNNMATLEGSTFNPFKLGLAAYTFKYTIEDEFCPTETTVNITLNDDCVPLSCGADDVVISKAVTTNADGKNDFFTISGVETCGFTYEVQIFNRWGAKIYESKNYQNDWNGTASKASIGGSNYVPTGTYYYVVNLKNSGLKPFSGSIYVATK